MLGRSLPLEPAAWLRRELHGWSLLHEPSLPARELLDAGGAPIGWLLGHPLGLASTAAATDPACAPVAASDADFRHGFEQWLYAHGGRFVAVVLHPAPTLYPDAGGSLPVLFDPELRCAASSPFLLATPDRGVPDSALVDALAVYETGSWFTLGATPHARATLALPNHAVDLASWSQSRIWPLESLEPDDVATSVERIAATLERTLAAVAASGTPNVGFTAGGDSRSFLACSRGLLDRLRFFTVAVPDEIGATDLTAAPELARRFGLAYRILPWREPDAADVELFMYRTGCLVGERRGRLATRTYDQLGGGEAYVSGVGAEMARGIGWRRDDEPGLRLAPEDLLARFGLLRHPELVRRAAGWLAALPAGLDGLDALTLFHVEMRLGGWGGPLTTAYPDAYSFTLYPYAHRAVVEAVLRLPWQYRRDGRLPADVIAARWPELLDVPVNRPPLRVSARRAARVPVRLARRSAGRALRLVKRSLGGA